MARVACVNVVFSGPSDLGASYFCEWALGMCSTAAELKAAVLNGTVNVHKDALTSDQHFVARDALGKSVVVEFIGGEPRVYDDFNDGGVTGFGVMTNEPPFDWHAENVRHFEWKQGLGREATTMPGTWCVSPPPHPPSLPHLSRWRVH